MLSLHFCVEPADIFNTHIMKLMNKNNMGIEANI